MSEELNDGLRDGFGGEKVGIRFARNEKRIRIAPPNTFVLGKSKPPKSTSKSIGANSHWRTHGASTPSAESPTNEVIPSDYPQISVSRDSRARIRSWETAHALDVTGGKFFCRWMLAAIMMRTICHALEA